MDAGLIWEECLAFIRSNTSPEVFDTWFKPVRAVSVENKTLTIEVPSHLYYEWLETHYVKLLHAALTKTLGRGAKLVYTVRMSNKSTGASLQYPGKEKPSVPIHNHSPHKGQEIKNPFVIPGVQKIRVNSNLNPNYTFENFIEGKHNRLARSAGLAIAKQAEKVAFNPLFIYGGVGLGKTHLANAIGIEIKRLFPDKNVLYVSMEKFTQQYTSSVINNTRNDFINFYQMMDVLIVDDVQSLAGKEGAQKVFFQIFNHLHQNKKLLIFTSDQSPAEMKDIKVRLLSRFKWGLTAELKSPDYETRVQIIKDKIRRDGIRMPEEVIHFIAKNVTSNIREMEGVLTSLIAHAAFGHSEINLELAEEVVGIFIKSKKPQFTCDMIKQIVVDYFGLQPEDLESKSRKRAIVQARQIAMYLSKKFTKASLEQIGKKIGKKDHATVIYSLKVVNDLMDTDKKFRKIVSEIEEALYNV